MYSYELRCQSVNISDEEKKRLKQLAESQAYNIEIMVLESAESASYGNLTKREYENLKLFQSILRELMQEQPEHDNYNEWKIAETKIETFLKKYPNYNIEGI